MSSTLEVQNNDKWIGYLLIPFAGVFTYYVGAETPFYASTFDIFDFVYIVANILSGLIVWQIIKSIINKYINNDLTLLLFLKAFALNLIASLFYLIVTRFLHDSYIAQIETRIEFYTEDIPVNFLFISIINLIYLILYFRGKTKRQSGITATNSLPSQKIIIQSGKKVYSLLPAEIAFVELENKVSFLHTSSGDRIGTTDSLAFILQKLPKSTFFQANRQFLLHRDMIRSFELTETRKLRIHLIDSLEHQKDIFISKAKSHSFKRWFLNHEVSEATERLVQA